MATYKGVAGIDRLQQKIERQHKTLVQIAIEDIANMIVNESPVGSKMYSSKQGLFHNDPGDFKNSWLVDFTGGKRTHRHADPSGSASIVSAQGAANKFNFQSNVYIYNNSPQAKNIEKEGWVSSDPFRQKKGWDVDKPPYKPVKNNKSVARVLLEQAILKAKGVR